jgi:hypothetical protein
MPEHKEPKPDSQVADAAEHVAAAHALLKVLEEKLGKHPELGQVIHKLEVALAILGIKTGAML